MTSIRDYINIVEGALNEAPQPVHPLKTFLDQHFYAQDNYDTPNRRNYVANPSKPVQHNGRFEDGGLHGALTKRGYTRGASVGGVHDYQKNDANGRPENLRVQTDPAGNVTNIGHRAVGA